MEEIINVAITGTLSQPRSKVAEQINATENACFVESVTLIDPALKEYYAAA
jgi:hypothetical protein